jgi:hypothetical protein
VDATTSYNVKARSALSCESTEATTNVTMEDAPTGLTLSASSTTVCKNAAVTLTASATGAASYSFDANPYGTAASTTRTVTAASTYNVKAKSTIGCESAATTRAVAVQAAPTNVTLSASSTTVCKGTDVKLTASPASAVSFQFNGGDWQTARTTTVTVTATTSYNVKARSALSCESAETTTTVTVQAAPTGITLSASPTNVCSGSPVTLTASASSAASYQFNDGAWKTATTATVTVSASTSYKVKARSALGCESSEATRAVTMYPVFTAGSITTASGVSPKGTQPDVTIASSTNASGGNGGISIQWRRSGKSSATLTGSNQTYPLNDDAANYSDEGTYYFNRYAHDATCNSGWVASTGTYTLSVEILPEGAGTKTWTCGALTWSGPVRVGPSYCTLVTSLSSVETTDREYFNANNGSGYYYNAPCALYSQTGYCNTPWRYPTNADATAAVSCLESMSAGERASLGLYGYADVAKVNYYNDTGYIWYYHSGEMWALMWDAYNTAHRARESYTRFGRQVRCVR